MDQLEKKKRDFSGSRLECLKVRFQFLPVKGNGRLATSSLPLARFASVRRAFGALFRGRLVASPRAGPIVAYFWPEVDMKKCLIFFWKRISQAG